MTDQYPEVLLKRGMMSYLLTNDFDLAPLGLDETQKVQSEAR